MIFNTNRVSTAALAALCAAGLLVSGCMGNRDRRERVVYQERPVELLFSTGARRLDQRRWDDAIAYFEEVERQHPYSEWSRRAILMTLYAHYQSGDYADAIAAADRFIQLYPGNPQTPYAYYMRAVSYYEQITDVGRDQAATAQAQAALREVISRYPNTEYAADARLKLDTSNDQLAGKEMAVGRYYLRQNQPLAAIGRFKTVIDKYQTTTHTPEALYRLVEAYLSIGLTEEARRNAAVLGHNYAGDQWYADAYALMTDRGLQPATAPRSRGFGLFRRGPQTAARQTAAPALAAPPEAVANPQ
ncbi:MAG: outer membrane protein assembly factor BamD [Pseudomonadota bacterium]|nr:outer membrane protein assembly factor BamD [Pseudomonadota bacterium]